MNASEQIERIEVKIRRLLGLAQELKRDNLSLQDENSELKAVIVQKDATIRALQIQVERASQGMEKQRREEAEQSEKLKEQIDPYAKEIDERNELLANN